MIKLNIEKQLLNKQAREGRKIGLSEVTQSVNISRNALYHYINGKSNAYELLDALCEYFDCEPGDLLERIK